MQHFLDTRSSDLSLARSYSLLRPFQPQPFPVMLLGSNVLHQFFQHARGTIVSPAAGDTLRVTIADALSSPVLGKIVFEGDDTSEVDALATPEEIAAALSAIPSVAADGGVDVSGFWPSFLVAYKAVGATTGFTASAALLSPTSTAEMSVLAEGTSGVRELIKLTFRTTALLQTTDFTVIDDPHDGWEGRLPLTSAAAHAWLQVNGALVSDYLQAQSLITVEVIDDDGNVTPIYQAPVTIRGSNAATEAAETVTTASGAYFTAKPSVTGLASATENALKLGGLTTAGAFNTGTTVRLFFANDVVVDYRLFASTASQSWPFIIRPYDYNASTNARQWALVEVRKGAMPCVWNADSSLFHFNLGGGLPTAVFLEVDQTGFALPA